METDSRMLLIERAFNEATYIRYFRLAGSRVAWLQTLAQPGMGEAVVDLNSGQASILPNR